MKTESTRFNFVSADGDGIGFAVRLAAEGEDVRVFIGENKAAEVGDGLVDKVGSIHDLMRGATPERDVFVFDMSGNGMVADYLRSMSFPVFGASSIADRLEQDRAFGLGVMEDAGIQIPPTWNFTDWQAGIDFVKGEGKKKRLVYKPSKHLGDLSLSLVTEDSDALVALLENNASEVQLERPEFSLQEFIEGGLALSSECWFDGNTFVDGLFNHTIERKELMNDNLGPSGGCTGNIVWACPGGRCPICAELRKMEAFLRRERYHGMLDLNALVNENGVYGLEWTPRCGYDATPTLLWGLYDGEIAKFFADFARGQGDFSNALLDGYAAGIRISVPPWPSERYEADKNVPVDGLDASDLRYSYLFNIKAAAGRSQTLETAGAWGILLCFIDRGDSVGRAFSRPYRMAGELKVASKQFRTDLVKQFKDDLEKLHVLVGLDAVEVDT